LIFYKVYFVFVVAPTQDGGRHGRDRMVVGFTTTYAIGAFHH